MINRILKGDCLDLMKDIPSGSIDLIICDLPYGTTQNKWDTVIPFGPLWEQYERIIKPNGAIVLTAQSPFDKILGCSNLKLLKYEMIWQKTQPTGFLNAKKRPMKYFENILVFYKKQPTYNPQFRDKPEKNIRPAHSGKLVKTSSNYGNYALGDFREIPADKSYPSDILVFPNSQNRIHPTEKPVPLFEYLIKTYTNEGDLVLDNCSGSGTTAIACINTNRRFICMEQDKEYYRLSSDRVEKHTLELMADLF